MQELSFGGYRFDPALAVSLGRTALAVATILLVTWVLARVAKWSFARLVDRVPLFQKAAASGESVGAALGTPAGLVLATAEGVALLRDAMAEIVRLANHRGIGLDDGHIARTLAFVGGFPRDATTSLQRDLAAQRPSEYDALTAAVPRLAAQSGVAVSVFPELERMIAARTIARGRELPCHLVRGNTPPSPQER